MPRKRTELGTVADAEIAVRTARGEPAEAVAAALGNAVSVSTIRRRQAELRNGPPRAAARTAPETVEAEDVPEEVPPGTPVEMIDRWIARVEKGASEAERLGNLPALSSLAMRAASLAEARRKAVPIPKADPNENPDMIALAKLAETRLFALIDDLFAPGAA